MKKEYILKENEDFSRIIKSNKPFKYKEFIIYKENTNELGYHFGISVGKKIGNAVRRNRVKRQIRSIISKYLYKKGFNCIIIVNRGINDINFAEMEENLVYILNKLNLMRENNEKI